MALGEIDEDDLKAFLVESYENLNQIERDIIDLEKTSIEIWEQLSKLFGEKSINPKFSLKLQLFGLKCMMRHLCLII